MSTTTASIRADLMDLSNRINSMGRSLAPLSRTLWDATILIKVGDLPAAIASTEAALDLVPASSRGIKLHREIRDLADRLQAA